MNGVAGLSTAAAEQVLLDCNALALPIHVSRETIEELVRSRLAQHPLVLLLNDFATSPRRFGEMSAFVGSWLSTKQVDRDPREAWQTLMRWLLHFFPTRYQLTTPRFTEIFQARR